MPDFTSVLYLGLRHPAEALSYGPSLTSGVPAALYEHPAAQMTAQGVAQLTGFDRAVLGPSSFHLFWDLCDMLAREKFTFYLDNGAYPIARWGVERAAGRGARVARFAHHNAHALQRAMASSGSGRPVVVTDGICSACGCGAPLDEYLRLAQRHNGLLLVDDTQALGILGAGPAAGLPYGRGGGGSLRYLGLKDPDVVTISSLAKAFGAPLAALTGSKEMVHSFEQRSATRVHCSPPSLVAVEAARRALRLNTVQGDALRRRLLKRVRRFQALLAREQLASTGGSFPVQTPQLPPGVDARKVYERLLARGVRAVLRLDCQERKPVLSFVVTARHRTQQLEEAVWELSVAVAREQRLQFA